MKTAVFWEERSLLVLQASADTGPRRFSQPEQYHNSTFGRSFPYSISGLMRVKHRLSNFFLKIMKQKTFSDQNIVYQIKTRGSLNPDWLICFDGLSAVFNGEISTVSGVFTDQATLRGLLNCLWDLNLTVLSVTTKDRPHNGEGVTENE